MTFQVKTVKSETFYKNNTIEVNEGVVTIYSEILSLDTKIIRDIFMSDIRNFDKLANGADDITVSFVYNEETVNAKFDFITEKVVLI